jgi:hypothetical protein
VSAVVQADEAQNVFGEWGRVALEQGGIELPASLCGRIQADIPEGSQWAVADARTLLALGSDQVLRSLAVDADDRIMGDSRSLAGASIAVSHSTDPVEFYRDTETIQRHRWRFSIDGEELALTGTVYGERGRPRDRPDRLQRLAFDLQEVAAQSARRPG